VCDNFRKAHGEALITHVAKGGRTKYFNRLKDDCKSWFHKVPGLRNEIELMAWRVRSQSALFYVTASDSDADGSGIRIQMITRSQWDEDPSFPEAQSTRIVTACV
jgi:hypothetical protein